MADIESINESVIPKFATVVRGYDRMQVDDYVERLNAWVEQSDYRAQQAESRAARASAEAEKLHRRLGALDAGTLTATPESVKALGDRVGQIMQSSFHAAENLRQRAEMAAQSAAVEAEERALAVLAQATERAEELSSAAETLFGQAQQALDGAEKEAARRADEARHVIGDERSRILDAARAEAAQILRDANQQERALREQMSALNQQRQDVLREIGLLHSRLGDIGAGLHGAGAGAGATHEPSHPKDTPAPDAPPNSANTLRLAR